MQDLATRYARSGSAHIAYQVRDGGPVDLLYMSEWVIPIQAMSEGHLGRFLDRLNSFCRVLTWDRRGVGQSDPLAGDERQMLELWVDDTIAVMDAVGLERAALLGSDIGGQVAMLFAATHPERTSALVLVNTCPRFSFAADYPFGVPLDAVNGLLATVEDQWGSGYPPVDLLAPDHKDDRSFLGWSDRAQQLGASPSTASAILEMSCRADLRATLPSIRVPTLVMHSQGDQLMSVEHGRYVGAHVPEARYVELPGSDHPIFLTDGDLIVDEVEDFLTGVRRGPDPDRVVATVLFTDIVGSTELARTIGDRRWRGVLDAHNRLVREALAQFRGREVQTTGDGFLATFDGPGRGIRCARAVLDAAAKIGLTLRAGLHAGEIAYRDNEVAGVAVHIAARVSALAGPAEILVSRTVVDLVAGSEFRFADRGDHDLKGIPDKWRLFAVSAADAS